MRTPISRLICLGALFTTIAASPAWSLQPTNDELKLAQTWAQGKLTGETGTTAPLPFSFTYDGRASAEAIKSWKMELASRKIDETRTEHATTWTDPATGLSVRCVAVEYTDFPVVEWTLRFPQRGNEGHADHREHSGHRCGIRRPRQGPNRPAKQHRRSVHTG